MANFKVNQHVRVNRSCEVPQHYGKIERIQADSAFPYIINMGGEDFAFADYELSRLPNPDDVEVCARCGGYFAMSDGPQLCPKCIRV